MQFFEISRAKTNTSRVNTLQFNVYAFFVWRGAAGEGLS